MARSVARSACSAACCLSSRSRIAAASLFERAHQLAQLVHRAGIGQGERLALAERRAALAIARIGRDRPLASHQANHRPRPPATAKPAQSSHRKRRLVSTMLVGTDIDTAQRLDEERWTVR